jgi:hypothetical protein
MDPITYTIDQAAEILKCKEENILHMGVTGHWKIYVLSSISPLYHIIKTFNQQGDDIEQCHFPKEYEVEVPRDEDDRLPFQRLMQLSPCYLERFEAIHVCIWFNTTNKEIVIGNGNNI